MKRSVVQVWAIFFAMATLSYGSNALAITNGQADGDAHPYVFALWFFYVDDSNNRTSLGTCSGSLIAPRVVLTTAHCTKGSNEVMVWPDTVWDDEGNLIPPSIVGTPYAHPDYCPSPCGHGVPEFSFYDVGVVILDDAFASDAYGELPTEGELATLKNKTDLTLVGYGAQYQHHGNGQPFWFALGYRMMAPSQLIAAQFKYSDMFLRMTMNPGGGKGGFCFGDSGGPVLLNDTNLILGVNSYLMNSNCAGVGHSSRVDIPEVLDWIGEKIDESTPPTQ